MEAGHKKNVFFLETTACVCVTNGGEVRGLGVGGKNVENVDVVSKVKE